MECTVKTVGGRAMILVIHENQKVEVPKKDMTAELIASAVRTFSEEDVQTWPELQNVDSFKEGQLLCLSVGDYRKVIKVCSSSHQFFTFELVSSSKGKPEKGMHALAWNVLEKARYKSVELPAESYADSSEEVEEA